MRAVSNADIESAKGGLKGEGTLSVRVSKRFLDRTKAEAALHGMSVREFVIESVLMREPAQQERRPATYDRR